MINDPGKEKCAFMLAPGLKSFMQRSFPGARIWSQQSLLKEAGTRSQSTLKLLADVRENVVDIILLNRDELLCAATHLWKTESDIAYCLFNILLTYNVKAKDTELIFSGKRETRHKLGKMIAPYFKSLSQKNHDLDGKSIPTSVYLAINRKKGYANHTR